jgi:hypothetical protein
VKLQRSVLLFSVASAIALVVVGCATEGTMGPSGAGPASGAGAASTAPGAGVPVIQSDSLQACLARIALGASPGMRQIAEESCRRDEVFRTSIVGTATTKSNDRAASGTQGDSLEACMARIPKDASAGQRMLAEESCRRDQANRR